MFWNFGGSADGGTIDKHLRDDASRFAISYKKLVAATITRKPWYAGEVHPHLLQAGRQG